MKNNKGFMLAEVIITATVIITALVGLYATYNRTATKFQTRSTYNNIDGNYAIKGMINHLLKGNINNVFQSANSSGIALIQNNNCLSSYNDTYCQKLKELYNIQNMLVTKYDYQSITTLKNSNSNKTWKNYIEYLSGSDKDHPGYYDLGTTDVYSYIFIVEYKDINGKLNYSSMGVK